MKEKLLSITADERRALSEKICENLASLPEFSAAKKVFLYVPLKSEPDVLPLAEAARTSGKRVAYPATDGGSMRYFACGKFKAGGNGIPEPDGGEELLPDSGTFVVVPALAYSESGYRLGRGGGFFDRFLSGKDCTAVGAAFSFSVLADGAFTVEPHDIPVSVIVTDSGVIRRKDL